MEENDEMNEVNMEQFMDVVVAYKCRFCDVTCSTTQQMGAHIKQFHMFPVPDNPEKQNADDEQKNNNDKQTDSFKRLEEPEAINIDEVQVIGIKNEPHSQDPNSSEGPQRVESSLQSAVRQELESREGTVQGEQYTLTSSSDMAPNTQLTTKLLYVCGQCSVGFNSIDDCKEHMVESHEQLESNMEIEELEATSTHVSAQVSVGTQMEPRKKPGRKKKSEIKQEVVTSEESEDDDKDWVPENPTGRSRRKIRPPRALKEDYYINSTKKKKNKKRKNANNKELKHKCYLYGCLARFSTKENLDIHVACHNTSNEAFTCTQCEKHFDSWQLLRVHLHRKHDIDLDLISCDVCGFKVDTMNKLRVHKEIHSDSRPYTCDICGKGFRQYSQMKNHQQVHSEYQKKVEKDMTCPTCQRNFVNKKCLLNHQHQVHSNEKKFKCNVCPYASTRKAMLDLHSRIHTGEKPFKCDLCAYATGDHNSLRRHKMRHTGQKQYKCSFCPYSCIQSVSLKSHLRSKHPGSDSNFFCEDCNFQSVSKSAYDNHIQDHKNGRIVNRPKAIRRKTTMVAQTDTHDVDLLAIPENSESTQVKMLVQTMKSGEAQVSAEDLAKLSCYEGLMTGEMSAAQLIYSALNAIGQGEKTGVPQTAEISGGVQCTTLSAESEEGVTSHTITFHLPANFQNTQPEENETVLFGQPVEIIETVDENAVRFIESNLPDEATTDDNGNMVIGGVVLADQGQGQIETAVGDYDVVQQTQQSYIVVNGQNVIYQQAECEGHVNYENPEVNHQRVLYQQTEVNDQFTYVQPDADEQTNQTLEIGKDQTTEKQDGAKYQQASSESIIPIIPEQQMTNAIQPTAEAQPPGTESHSQSEHPGETMIVGENVGESSFVQNQTISNQIMTIDLQQIVE